ncbi:uncharacterized protein PADG_11543 [Paracoccidioides brasiliensis Pb18]|uniref:Uncharacterized protein n=1 Tax=Paracoccidioides brasiliensis (strain Pb18) TaxID=502780 RepID=A0A0A0HWB8_PARBD|nr:uncharacterized protein PADG_11543 [Paracoccidioides brasiliensis Pb18]KGM92346.1 hypothetical protein PADG_11543 [Paracoccidioides brasiliensis Pb18]
MSQGRVASMPPHDGSGGALVSGTSRYFIYDGHQKNQTLEGEEAIINVENRHSFKCYAWKFITSTFEVGPQGFEPYFHSRARLQEVDACAGSEWQRDG